jgi:hypothetical protein
MGTRPEDLTGRLAATGAGGGEVEHEHALPESKKQIIGYWTKKLPDWSTSAHCLRARNK